jgi:alpha-L-fucosidase
MPEPFSRRAFVLSLAAAATGTRLRAWTAAAARPVPSPSQLEWQHDELALFLHFGVNTFTDREWGDGKESPSIFAPARLDARQWARAAKAGGFRAMILTAKHHDGFCLWPTRTTDHSVKSSPFRGGGGDIVREFVDACRAESLKPGLYLSPWDRNARVYGDSPATTTSTASSSRNCSRSTGRSMKSGSTAPMVKGRTGRSRSTTGRACGDWCAGCSRPL